MPGFVKLATVDQIPPGSAKEFEHQGRVYAVFNVEGAFWAIDGICPHQGGPLADGPVEGTIVTCPWHGWQFDIRNGSTTLNGKLKQPVYEVKVEGNDVLVNVV